MRLPNRRMQWVGAFALVLLAVAGCAAGDARYTPEDPAGFWTGLWHGMISIVTLVVGIFSDTVEVYERNNSGGWYDLGFLFGVLCIWGGGSKAAPRRRRAPRPTDPEWDAIGRKVEAKLKRKIRTWAEAEPDEDWDVVEAKAEEKLKLKVREWAESDL